MLIGCVKLILSTVSVYCIGYRRSPSGKLRPGNSLPRGKFPPAKNPPREKSPGKSFPRIIPLPPDNSPPTG